jgi:hypothetical protein
MNETTIKEIIRQNLPEMLAQDPLVRDFVLRTVSSYYAVKSEADSKFDRILAELQRDREEQTRKWDENNRKWDENNRKWDEQLAEIRRLDRRFDSTIGALGSRWGLSSEASFRNALKGILGESFGVEVLNVNLFDQEGEVFGRPDQVEIDVIIKNGLTIACEIKSSIDKAGMYSFDRKVTFYEKYQGRQVNRRIVICPMVAINAVPVAEALAIEIYSYADGVEDL